MMLLGGCMDRLIAREFRKLSDDTPLTDGGLHVVFGGTGTLSNHSTAQDAACIAAAAGVDPLALSHISPPPITPMLRWPFLRSARSEVDGDVVIVEDGNWIDLEEL